jgi:hypothetical protein
MGSSATVLLSAVDAAAGMPVHQHYRCLAERAPRLARRHRDKIKRVAKALLARGGRAPNGWGFHRLGPSGGLGRHAPLLILDRPAPAAPARAPSRPGREIHRTRTRTGGTFCGLSAGR